MFVWPEIYRSNFTLLYVLFILACSKIDLIIYVSFCMKFQFLRKCMALSEDVMW